MNKLKMIKIGNSVGAIFPKELLAELGVGEGDIVVTTNAPDGVRLTTYDPDQSEKIQRARAIMSKRRHALRELAK